MSTPWRYADPSNRVVFRVLPNGVHESTFASEFQGVTPDPYVAPLPSVAELRAAIDLQLAALDAASARTVRELVLDDLNVKNLTIPLRVALRAQLKQRDDDADALRATRP